MIFSISSDNSNLNNRYHSCQKQHLHRQLQSELQNASQLLRLTLIIIISKMKDIEVELQLFKLLSIQIVLFVEKNLINHNNLNN